MTTFFLNYGVAATPPPEGGDSLAGDEFVGPFTTWLNVKTGYGAVGDGTTDDTTAIQNALNALSASSPVLYFPAGTYKITSLLSLTDKLNVSVIGEDPATTSIAWYGGAGTMFHINGVAYSRFNRLTWDGRSGSVTAIAQQWDGSGGNFDTGNEYADNVFVDMSYGIYGGFAGEGFAETSVLRCQFKRMDSAGISLGNFNALDLWIWNSLFEDCYYGVTNTFGAGNFNIYNSTFKRSTTADIGITNVGFFNFRNNYSINSAMFLDAGFTQNPAVMTIQGNTILDTTTDKTIDVRNLGPLLLVDNVIRSKVGATAPIVGVVNSSQGDLFSVGNTFSVASPLSADGRTRSISDTVVDRSTINPSEPTLPGTLTNNSPTIYYVASGSNAATVQGVIDAAVADSVIHLPPTTLSISTTLTLPANKRLTFMGDGDTSLLNWTGSGTGPVLKLQGPTRVILRDFEIQGDDSTIDGIVVETADQVGARVFMEQARLLETVQYNLFVDALTNTYVQLQDFSHSQNMAAASSYASIKITGSSETNFFAGASANVYGDVYNISGSPRVLIQDIWYEGIDAASFVDLTGSGTVTINGQRIASAVTAMNIDITAFSGIVALLNLLIDSEVVTAGNCTGGRLLGVGLVGDVADFWDLNASPAATALLLNSQTSFGATSPSTVPVADEGSYDTTFITNAMAQMRAEEPPTTLAAVAAGITDLRMYRVTVVHCRIGVHVKAGS